jgi:hypothetical protein
VDITFTGYAMTHNDVAEFMTRLGLLPQIDNIKLINSAITIVGNTKLAAFQITVQLRPFLVAPPLSGSVVPATTPLPTAPPTTTPSPGASP